MPRVEDAVFFHADPLRAGQPVEAHLRITIAAPIRLARRKDRRRVFEREGQELARVLWEHLPGGTVDQLLAALLLHRASELVVRRP